MVQPGDELSSPGMHTNEFSDDETKSQAAWGWSIEDQIAEDMDMES